MLTSAWIESQPESRLRFPGASVLHSDSREEEPVDPGDPQQTSAYVRAFLSAPADRETVAQWYGDQLEQLRWRLARAPLDHPQHYRRYRRDNLAFNLFLYDRSPFDRDGMGAPGPAAFRVGHTVHQLFLEGRENGFSD